jgi:hypothetical protein
MSAEIKLTETDSSQSSSLPNSRRVYIDGEQPGVRVPFREFGSEELCEISVSVSVIPALIDEFSDQYGCSL